MTVNNENDKTAPLDIALQDLDLVPEWAREAPNKNPYERAFIDDTGSFPRSGRGKAPRRSRDDRRKQSGDRRSGRPPRSGSHASASADTPPRRARSDRQTSRSRRAPHTPSAPPPSLPIHVSFLPDQERLSALAADIRSSTRAFPLIHIAGVFLSRPSWHQIRLELAKGPGRSVSQRMCQAGDTGHVFWDREACEAYLLEVEMANRFERVTVQNDPPAGNFVCVARCRLSGVLLGPPNHHGYNERLEMLHRTRFSHLSLNAYREHIETLREPEMIEQWKEEWRTVTMYRPKGVEASSEEPLTEKDAIQYLRDEVLPKQITTVHRAVLTGDAGRDAKDPAILHLLRRAWSRESRFPGSMMRALRGAFKHMGLHLFKGENRAMYVTAIPPKPLGQEKVIPMVAEILSYLGAHPGATRQSLIAHFHPETEVDPEKIAEISLPLAWLIERGHVIELYNGKLSVPVEKTAVPERIEPPSTPES